MSSTAYDGDEFVSENHRHWKKYLEDDRYNRKTFQEYLSKEVRGK